MRLRSLLRLFSISSPHPPLFSCLLFSSSWLRVPKLSLSPQIHASKLLFFSFQPTHSFMFASAPRLLFLFVEFTFSFPFVTGVFTAHDLSRSLIFSSLPASHSTFLLSSLPPLSTRSFDLTCVLPLSHFSLGPSSLLDRSPSLSLSLSLIFFMLCSSSFFALPLFLFLFSHALFLILILTLPLSMVSFPSFSHHALSYSLFLFAFSPVSIRFFLLLASSPSSLPYVFTCFPCSLTLRPSLCFYMLSQLTNSSAFPLFLCAFPAP